MNPYAKARLKRDIPSDHSGMAYANGAYNDAVTECLKTGIASAPGIADDLCGVPEGRE